MHITDRIGYPFLKLLLFVVCFVFYIYCILVLDLLRRVTSIRIFFVRIKTNNKLNKKFTIILPSLSVNNKNNICIIRLRSIIRFDSEKNLDSVNFIGTLHVNFILKTKRKVYSVNTFM